MKRNINSSQLRSRLEAIKITGTATPTPAVVIGSSQFDVSKSGTGEFDLIINEPFDRECIPQPHCLKVGAYALAKSSTATSFTVEIRNRNTDALEDGDFTVHLVGFDSSSEM